MSFEDRLEWMLLGCVLGFVLGYIVRLLQEILTKVERVDTHICKRSKNEDGILRHPVLFDVVIGVLVIATGYAAIVSGITSAKLQQNYKDDQVSRCVSGVETREVQRDLVDSVYTLATESFPRDPEAEKLTREQIRQYNRYIQSVNSFREDMYEKIKPSKKCEPYVNDENVKPKDPEYPRLVVREDRSE